MNNVNEQHIEELNRKVEDLQVFRDDVLPVILYFWKAEIRQTGGPLHSPSREFCTKYFAGQDIEL